MGDWSLRFTDEYKQTKAALDEQSLPFVEAQLDVMLDAVKIIPFENSALINPDSGLRLREARPEVHGYALNLLYRPVEDDRVVVVEGVFATDL